MKNEHRVNCAQRLGAMAINICISLSMSFRLFTINHVSHVSLERHPQGRGGSHRSQVYFLNYRHCSFLPVTFRHTVVTPTYQLDVV